MPKSKTVRNPNNRQSDATLHTVEELAVWLRQLEILVENSLDDETTNPPYPTAALASIVEFKARLELIRKIRAKQVKHSPHRVPDPD